MLVAQEARARVAAPIDELGKIDRDQRQPLDVPGKRIGIVVRLEPDADIAARGKRVVLGLPQRERHDDRRIRRDVRKRGGLAEQHPAVLDDGPAFNEQRHTRAP